MTELERAYGSGYTATSEDQLSYVMFQRLPEQALKLILN